MAVSLEASFPVIGGPQFDNTQITQTVTVGWGSNRLMVVFVPS